MVKDQKHAPGKNFKIFEHFLQMATKKKKFRMIQMPA